MPVIELRSVASNNKVLKLFSNNLICAKLANTNMSLLRLVPSAYIHLNFCKLLVS